MRKHGIVFAADGIYAGWPANHGAWQWGDEFLVGFLTGRHGKKSMHNCYEPFTKHIARSVDGGITWRQEKPNVDFDGHDPVPFTGASKDAIYRVCGVYDHGGDDCPQSGSFYSSEDRGRNWAGPFLFNGIKELFSGEFHNTSRTCVLGDLWFVSNAKVNHWGTDETYCVRLAGERFELVGKLAENIGRVVMPSAVRLGDRLVVAARRRMNWQKDGWIDAFVSDDDGLSWKLAGRIGDTGSHNGNPPALAVTNGRLVCVFANRDERRICVSYSDDGTNWTFRETVRDCGVHDIGYPRLFVRSDGVPVCVYYWADESVRQQHIAYTVMGDA